MPFNQSPDYDRVNNEPTKKINTFMSVRWQALHVTEVVSNLTSKADTFEESDVSLSTDIVDNVLESQENVIEVAVAHGLLQTVDNLLSVDNDVLLASQESHNSATRLLESVERLSRLIEADNGSVTIVTQNIVLTVSKVNATVFKGLSFSSVPTSSQVVDKRTVSGLVIAASIGDLTIINLREPVKITLAKNTSYRTINESCVFWDYNLNGKNGAWSSEGCTVSPEENDNNSVLCECNHLTNFALLVDIYNEGINIDSPNQKVLSIISNVGCTVSLFALAVAIVSLIAYKKKKDKDKVTMLLLNLCLALFMAYLMFLIGSFSTDFAPIIPELCITVAVVLHYFLLSVLAWMALQAVQLYLLFVKVFKTYIRRFMVKFCLLGWGVPLIFVIVTMAIDLNNYGYHNGICWLSRYPFYGAFLAPLCFVLIFNSVIYCLVINQLCRLDTRAMATNERYGYLAQLRAAIGLMVLLGLTWVFAFFAIGQASLVFNYLFAIFNSLQGLFIFVFHCAMKKEIQKGWRKTFCRCRRHKYRFVGTAVEERGDKNEQAMSTFKEYAYTDTSTEQKGHGNEQTMSTFNECTDVDTPMDHKDHDYEPAIPPTFKEYRYEKSMPNFKEYTCVQTMTIQYVVKRGGTKEPQSDLVEVSSHQA
ncbi:adhesion G-protein coupled receptor G6-like [Ptychodera flava]|uniref:adhesion G-protein coupled receptor G6-like n=1 Tax=Ptychodera flava TaxID=63121 RepID=UPI00396A68A6